MLKQIICSAFCILAMSSVTFAQTNVNHCLGATNGTWVSSPDGCEYFIWCSGNDEGQSGRCNDGRWFDFERQVCDWPENVDCDLDVDPVDPTDIECPATGTKRIPHPFSCRKYVFCLDGRQFDVLCEHGLHFSYELGTCVEVAEAKCKIDSKLCPYVDDVFSPTVIPSPRDCSVFYMCISQNIIPGRCAPGLHFNPERFSCDFPENVDCTPSLNPDEFLPEIIETKCEDSEDLIYHRHPQTCEHYFQCVNGESILRFCAPGLHFDVRQNRCDFPERAQCVAGPSPIVPGKSIPSPVNAHTNV